MEQHKIKDFAINLHALSEKEILQELRSIGYLPDNFDGADMLLKFCEYTNAEIRHYAIINLAKLSDVQFLAPLENLLERESVSKNRREIVAAIGRMRSPTVIDVLTKLLSDKDPSVILQAIRGLLVFRAKNDIREKLMKLHNHENELVRKIIDVEFFDKTNYRKDHSITPEDLKNKVFLGDSLDVLQGIDDESVHLTFTSPPYYNARDYSIYNSYDSYLAFLRDVFKQVHRVTKEGRFFVLNTSPIIIPRIGRKYSSTRYPIPYDLHKDLVEMGWEFIDDIVWVKPEPCAKNRVAGFEMHRKPLAYKPNCVTECIMVYRKKSNKLIDWIYDQYPPEIIEKSKVKDDYETSNVWYIDPTYDKAHTAVFPQKLCDRVIKYFSLYGDLVLDPFAGSGTVGVSARENNRYYFLVEKNRPYYEEIERKLKVRLL